MTETVTAESDWIEWHGGENPVPGAMVEVKLRMDDGGPRHEPTASSDRYRWNHLKTDDHASNADIIAYRVVSPAPVTDLWKDLSLSRIERTKAHRMQFGSDLKTAIAAVDEEEARQGIVAKARPTPSEVVAGARDLLPMLDDYFDRHIGATPEEDMSLEELLISRARTLLRKLEGA